MGIYLLEWSLKALMLVGRGCAHKTVPVNGFPIIYVTLKLIFTLEREEERV